jgi:hypothetical protein
MPVIPKFESQSVKQAPLVKDVDIRVNAPVEAFGSGEGLANLGKGLGNVGEALIKYDKMQNKKYEIDSSGKIKDAMIRYKEQIGNLKGQERLDALNNTKREWEDIINKFNNENAKNNRQRAINLRIGAEVYYANSNHFLSMQLQANKERDIASASNNVNNSIKMYVENPNPANLNSADQAVIAARDTIYGRFDDERINQYNLQQIWNKQAVEAVSSIINEGNPEKIKSMAISLKELNDKGHINEATYQKQLDLLYKSNLNNNITAMTLAQIDRLGLGEYGTLTSIREAVMNDKNIKAADKETAINMMQAIIGDLEAADKENKNAIIRNYGIALFEISNDKNLTPEEKQARINQLQTRVNTTISEYGVNNPRQIPFSPEQQKKLLKFTTAIKHGGSENLAKIEQHLRVTEEALERGIVDEVAIFELYAADHAKTGIDTTTGLWTKTVNLVKLEKNYKETFKDIKDGIDAKNAVTKNFVYDAIYDTYTNFVNKEGRNMTVIEFDKMAKEIKDYVIDEDYTNFIGRWFKGRFRGVHEFSSLEEHYEEFLNDELNHNFDTKEGIYRKNG